MTSVYLWWTGLGILAQLAIGFIGAVAIAFHIRWTRETVLLGPTLLTTLGIFFCFLGIALGLFGFDPEDVKGSVPHLLDGIRTSFWASVVGIAAALTIKGRRLLQGEPRQASELNSQGATIDDLANHLSNLNRSISGPDDSALLSQIRLSRRESNDHSERLQQSFQTFAEKMAEANSKALIAALSEVIRDFNSKMTEQFGDNFKQLNQAVERLILWQVQYETQLNGLIEQETATRQNMTEAAARYSELIGKAYVFVGVAESLDRLLLALANQSGHLDTALRSLAGLVNQAATGLPTIEQKIAEMTRQIEAGVRSNNDALGTMIKTSATTLVAHNEQLTTLLNSTIAAANKELNAHIRQASEDTRKNIVALDKALETELTKALDSLGQQLAALSQKFVQDYTPLTAQLQRLVQLSRESI